MRRPIDQMEGLEVVENNIEDFIWVTKYRPRSLDQMVINDSVLDFFRERSKDGNLNNILLVGKAGIGKTSLAKIIANEVMDAQYIYINASEENGIDTIRNKVVSFVETMSMNGKKKVVILDESDGITRSGQQALRNVMEKYLKTSSFILTANYSHKIIEPIKSRCQSFSIEYSKRDFLKHIVKILKKEGVSLTENGELAVRYIESFYPDFRRALNEIQKSVVDGVLNIRQVSTELDSFCELIYGMISKITEPKVIRKEIIENEDLFEADYGVLATALFNYVCEYGEDKYKVSDLLKLGVAIRNHNQVADVEINLFTSIIEMLTVR